MKMLTDESKFSPMMKVKQEDNVLILKCDKWEVRLSGCYVGRQL